ncbi:MAG: hypothetical protein ACLTZY_10985 [Alistipes indistinctus]
MDLEIRECSSFSAYEICSTDGMNEKGLVANLLWLAESEYPKWEGQKPGLYDCRMGAEVYARITPSDGGRSGSGSFSRVGSRWFRIRCPT